VDAGEEREKTETGFLHRLRLSEKAHIALEQIGGQELQESLGPLILTQEEEATLRTKWPKKQRQALEQKWSFSEIIRTSESYMKATTGKGILRTAAWNYGLSSHLIHADETGISVIGDRKHRPPIEQDKLTIAHAARMLSDYLAFMGMTSLAMRYALKKKDGTIERIQENAKPLFQELERLISDFYDEIRVPSLVDDETI
jgi:hypothetical protein